MDNQYEVLMDKAHHGLLKHDVTGTYKRVSLLANFAVLKVICILKATEISFNKEVLSEDEFRDLQERAARAKRQGAQIANHLASKSYFETSGDKKVLSDYVEVQERVPGAPVTFLNKYDNMSPEEAGEELQRDLLLLKQIPQAHYDKLLRTLKIMYSNGLVADYQNMGNFTHDKATGFWVVDKKVDPGKMPKFFVPTTENLQYCMNLNITPAIEKYVAPKYPAFAKTLMCMKAEVEKKILAADKEQAY